MTIHVVAIYGEASFPNRTVLVMMLSPSRLKLRSRDPGMTGTKITGEPEKTQKTAICLYVSLPLRGSAEHLAR